MGNQGRFAPCSLLLVPFAGYKSNSAVPLKIKSAHALPPSNSVTHYPSLKKTLLREHTGKRTGVFTKALFVIAKHRNPDCPSTEE